MNVDTIVIYIMYGGDTVENCNVRFWDYIGKGKWYTGWFDVNCQEKWLKFEKKTNEISFFKISSTSVGEAVISTFCRYI